jgi:hypothetical protein
LGGYADHARRIGINLSFLFLLTSRAASVDLVIPRTKDVLRLREKLFKGGVCDSRSDGAEELVKVTGDGFDEREGSLD